jgi:hypothetical protein
LGVHSDAGINHVSHKLKWQYNHVESINTCALCTLCTGSTSFLRKIESVFFRLLEIGQNQNGRARFSTNFSAIYIIKEQMSVRVSRPVDFLRVALGNRRNGAVNCFRGFCAVNLGPGHLKGGEVSNWVSNDRSAYTKSL